ncbi:MAG TPA: ABC-F family ATP-binding cassette domain-containing protein [Sphingobacterium sp.]|nr:ABC-F family ATP-binding cassette domain-containing protein [Sphingobacterium sp.]
MIAINDLSFEIGSRVLYETANWHLKPGDKTGLIGANGTGKSTLLRLIVGEYTPTGGSISMPKDATIGYLNQDLLSYQSDNSILQVAMEAFEKQNQLQIEIDDLLNKLEKEYSEDLLQKLSDKQIEFEALDGYSIEFKTHEILAGLGFSDEEQKRPLSTFSGGWRMRVMLAKILLQSPDILLLDEPTNHLDLPSIKWLEEYLQAFDGGIVIVSHDRYFLNRIINKTVEVRNGKLTLYAGNYNFYESEKALRNEIQQNEYKNQQARIKQEEKLIERFRAKASKAKMVQSRIKALERMEKVEEVDDDNPEVNFNFNFSKASGRHVVTLKNISKSYPNIDILSHTDGLIEKGDKIALIGANGKGKSTLLRIIAQEDNDFSGESIHGHNVTQTFFAQHQLEALHLDNTILDELVNYAPSHTETELRNILGSFLFSGDDVFKKIKVLSGGEKSRVALAKALTADANFLILDEPTNHLDITSVNILVQALQQYQGTFIVVSHDRYFLEQVANKIWYIEDKTIKEYPGTYAEYEHSQKSKGTKEEKSIPKKEKKKQQKPKDKNSKSLLQSKNRKLKQIEEKIETIRIEIKKIEEKLNDTDLYENQEKLNELTRHYESLKTDNKNLQNEWETVAEEILALEETI